LFASHGDFRRYLYEVMTNSMSNKKECNLAANKYYLFLQHCKRCNKCKARLMASMVYGVLESFSLEDLKLWKERISKIKAECKKRPEVKE